MPTPTPPSFYDPHRATLHHRDQLPHLRQENALYFITFRLADSLPAEKLAQLKASRTHWLKTNPPPHTLAQQSEYKKLWTTPIERLLDANHGSCLLRKPTARLHLENTLRHHDTITYHLGHFVIMPNHVHLLAHILPPHDLSAILKAWKSVSARRINKTLQRSGPLWLEESFDHIVRDRPHWQRFITYIQKNPAHCPPNTYTLSQGSLISP